MVTSLDLKHRDRMWSMLNECKSFLQTISWTNEICLSHELTNLVSLTNNQDVMAEINTRLKLWWQSSSLASISLLPNESATLGPCWSKQQKSRSWLTIYPKSSGYLESHYRLQVPAHTEVKSNYMGNLEGNSPFPNMVVKVAGCL